MQHLAQYGKLPVTAQPVIFNQIRGHLLQPPRQVCLILQHLINPLRELHQRLVGIILPVRRQAVIKKHIQHDA
ncbi:hypothetical protein SAMN02745752_01742 [Marinospirillum alkaliphilum DSM 21637]|uniref:Uncharacterized protein n=1 Tax=Marinospirillum alkaliphilum DSM 21637 TaxID=1122209 RepID=A0A1K1X6R0_9GAMM|nr:hypothetical protein SAMN02745752_01742 [Marinospirillum alkaliphilum DSM 21637]